MDLRIQPQVRQATRLARLRARVRALGPWELRWHEAEEHCFARAIPPVRLDLVLTLG